MENNNFKSCRGAYNYVLYAGKFMNRIILITGPKHSGKSLCLQALRELVNEVAIDLDELIEAQTGKTPRELYSIGVESFENAEAQALASVFQATEPAAKQRYLIIAAGGGLVDNDEAMALLSEAESLQLEVITVYLDVCAETAWQRIQEASAELPPFLGSENLEGLKPQETHKALHERRAEAYKAMSKIVISAENKTSMEIANEIIQHLAII